MVMVRVGLAVGLSDFLTHNPDSHAKESTRASLRIGPLPEGLSAGGRQSPPRKKGQL